MIFITLWAFNATCVGGQVRNRGWRKAYSQRGAFVIGARLVILYNLTHITRPARLVCVNSAAVYSAAGTCTWEESRFILSRASSSSTRPFSFPRQQTHVTPRTSIPYRPIHIQKIYSNILQRSSKGYWIFCDYIFNGLIEFSKKWMTQWQSRVTIAANPTLCPIYALGPSIFATVWRWKGGMMYDGE